jgi:hypothetical protein
MAAWTHLRETDKVRELVWLLEDNLADIREMISTFEANDNAAGENQSRDNRIRSRRVNAAVVNYLTSVRLYLDHRRTQLSRRYGNESGEVSALLDACKTTYDKEPVYRFIYKLRNYVQHCGMPLQVVRIREKLVAEGEIERRLRTVFIGCDRELLLSAYKDWGPARAFLEDQPEEFEIHPLLEYVHRLLWNIERACTRAEISDLWEHSRYIVRLLSEAWDDLHAASVVEVSRASGDPPVTNLHVYDPPLAALKALKFIEEASVPSGWRINFDVLEIPHPPSVY